LDAAGLRRAGAGRNEAEAKAPAVLQAADKGRVLVFSLASVTSGIPPEWAATGDRPGVNLLADLSERTARRTAAEVREVKRPGDVTIASIHWGANWGYEIPQAQVRFAHELIDGGVDLIHGHSSHHVKALEVYRNRLIIYGSGDFLNDYEGISGHETFRGDLTLMYLPRVDPARGHLVELRLVPMQVRRLRLNRAARDDAEWLRDVLNRYERQFGTAAHLEPDGTLRVRWA
jgi:poly-gamma-glutamate synthesis protein (capsule biosynthesis protein)